MNRTFMIHNSGKAVKLLGLSAALIFTFSQAAGFTASVEPAYQSIGEIADLGVKELSANQTSGGGNDKLMVGITSSTENLSDTANDVLNSGKSNFTIGTVYDSDSDQEFGDEINFTDRYKPDSISIEVLYNGSVRIKVNGTGNTLDSNDTLEIKAGSAFQESLALDESGSEGVFNGSIQLTSDDSGLQVDEGDELHLFFLHNGSNQTKTATGAIVDNTSLVTHSPRKFNATAFRFNITDPVSGGVRSGLNKSSFESSDFKVGNIRQEVKFDILNCSNSRATCSVNGLIRSKTYRNANRVYSEDFDDGSADGWTIQTSACTGNGVTSSPSGKTDSPAIIPDPYNSHLLQVAGDDIHTSPSSDLSGYEFARINLSMGSNSMDSSSEDTLAEVYDGSSWIEKKRIHNVPTSGSYLNNYSINISAELNSNFKARLDLVSSNGCGDYGYIDEINIFTPTLSPVKIDQDSLNISVSGSVKDSAGNGIEEDKETVTGMDEVAPELENLSISDLEDGDSILRGGDTFRISTAATDGSNIDYVTANLTALGKSENYSLVSETVSGTDWDGDSVEEEAVYGANTTVKGSQSSDQILYPEVEAVDSSGNSGFIKNRSEKFTIEVGDFMNGGNGSESNPYNITRLSHLNAMRLKINSDYILQKDIDASETRKWNSGEGWKPIVMEGDTGGSPYFSGTLDGDGHEIKGLYVDREIAGAAFIRKLGEEGRITRIGLVNLSISNVDGGFGGDYVGGLVGWSEGKISRVYTTGTVSGGDYGAGGIAGRSTGTMNNTYSTTEVTSKNSDAFANIVGVNTGKVSFSYSAGELVGGGSRTDGIVGGGTEEASDSYFDINTTGQSSGPGKGLYTYQMKNKSNYNWSFSLIWSREDSCNLGYPALRGITDCGKDVPVELRSVEAIPNKSLPNIQVKFQENEYPKWDKDTSITYDFDDGSSSSGLNPVHEFNNTGIYNVTVTLSNGTHQDTEFTTVNVTNPFSTSEPPFGLASCQDLRKIELGMSTEYRLVEDINCSGFNNSQGFSPIQTGEPFTGEIDGNGHKITGLFINESQNKVGLFRHFEGEVKDLKILNATVHGSDHTGTLAGYATGANISNLTLEATVNASWNGGGLIGQLKPEKGSKNVIRNIKYNVTTNGNAYAGSNSGPTAGLVGRIKPINKTSVVFSNLEGTVDLNDITTWAKGGVVGVIGYGTDKQGDILIENFNISGDIEGWSGAGVVGANGYSDLIIRNGSFYGTITASDGGGSYGGQAGGIVDYIWGGTLTLKSVEVYANISGDRNVGGIAGYIPANATVEDAYVQGNIEADKRNVGGIIGSIYGEYDTTDLPVEILNATFEGEISGLTDNPGGEGSKEKGYAGGILGQDTKTNVSIVKSSADAVIDTEGVKVGGIAGEISYSEIKNNHFSGEVKGRNYVGGVAGTLVNSSIYESYSTAEITGNRKVGGLIGVNNGTVNKSYATGSVSGSEKVGGLIGKNTGPVTTSFAKGDVVGKKSIGGLIGINLYNRSSGQGSGEPVLTTTQETQKATDTEYYAGEEGNITLSYATGDVTGLKMAGGLVGDNSGNIEKSFATGTVQAGSGVAGGLVGRNNGTINTSFSRGTVYGELVGGFVGEVRGNISDSYSTGPARLGSTESSFRGFSGIKYNGTIEDSYWDIESSGTEATAGSAIGLSTEEMKTKSGLEGLNFQKTWEFRKHSNDGYPMLQAFTENKFLNGSQVNIAETGNTTLSITIEPGRNFVSFPIQNGATYRVEDVIGSYSPMIKSVWTYNGSWLSSRPWDDSFDSDFTEIEGGKGYIIYSNASGEFTLEFTADKNSSDMPSGVKVESGRWNLIGNFANKRIENFGPLFGSATETGITIKKFSGQGFSDSDSLEPGTAYWAVPQRDTLYRSN